MKKIIGMHTHDSYQADFCSIPGVEMYHITNEKHRVWGAGARPKPSNLYSISSSDMSKIKWSEFDICITQSEQQYFELKDTPIKKIVIVHTVPHPLYHGSIYHQIMQDPNVVRMVFLTEEQVLAWRIPPMEVDVILPCVDVDAFPEWRTMPDRIPQEAVLTICNEMPKRAWCCGTNVWRFNTAGLPRLLVGEGNTGLGAGTTGFKSGEEVRLLMHDCSLYLNTNLHSPIGTSLLEAMAVGMPIVSTDTYAAHTYLTNSSDSISPKSAILTDVMPAMRQAVVDVLKDPERFREMGQAARRVAREVFNPDRFRNQWKLLLEEVCD